MSKSINKVFLIRNVTRDAELRYTSAGTPVCTFTLATNREWIKDGEKKEEAEFHKVVAWDKWGTTCAAFLTKGKKVYIEGRLHTQAWETEAGEKRQGTEVVLLDMIMLDKKEEVNVEEVAEEMDKDPEWIK